MLLRIIIAEFKKRPFTYVILRNETTERETICKCFMQRGKGVRRRHAKMFALSLQQTLGDVFIFNEVRQ